MPERADFLTNLNPNSLRTLQACKLEPSLAEAVPGSRYQFERLGYFFSDPILCEEGRKVFNRIVTLKDAWLKEVQKNPKNR